MKSARLVPMFSVVIAALAWLGMAGVAADHGRPHTFGKCVVAGGDVALRGGWPACVVVETGHDRMYGSITCDDGEEVRYEIWVERRVTIVTYLLMPERTIEHERGGIDDPDEAGLATPDACPAT